MPSNNPLIKAVKPAIIDVIENSRKKIAPSLASGVTSVSTYLPSTVAGATTAFQKTYADITGRVIVWLPTTVPALTGLLNKVLDKAVAGVKAA